jgi:hypothetical protein
VHIEQWTIEGFEGDDLAHGNSIKYCRSVTKDTGRAAVAIAPEDPESSDPQVTFGVLGAKEKSRAKLIINYN